MLPKASGQNVAVSVTVNAGSDSENQETASDASVLSFCTAFNKSLASELSRDTVA